MSVSAGRRLPLGGEAAVPSLVAPAAFVAPDIDHDGPGLAAFPDVASHVTLIRGFRFAMHTRRVQTLL
jgi:hypothetical protein